MDTNENNNHPEQKQPNQHPSLSEKKERRNRKSKQLDSKADEETERLVKEKRYKEAYQRCIELISQQNHVKYAKKKMVLLIKEIDLQEKRKNLFKFLIFVLLIILIFFGIIFIPLVSKFTTIHYIIVLLLLVIVFLFRKWFRVFGGRSWRTGYYDGLRLEYTPQITLSRICMVLKKSVTNYSVEEYEHWVDIKDGKTAAKISVVHNERRRFTNLVVEWKEYVSEETIQWVLEVLRNGIPDMIDDDY